MRNGVRIKTKFEGSNSARSARLSPGIRDSLRTLWDKAYVVNNPDNVVVEAKPDPVDRPVMQKARISRTRSPEKMTFRGDFAISMGSETIVPGDGQPRAGQTVKRRYTNIWMKQSGGWKLVARHANVVCL